MVSLDCNGELNMGAVILLTAVLFLGISIGVVAVHTSGFLSQPSATSAAISVQDDGGQVTVDVYDFGEYDRIEVSYGNTTQVLERADSVEFDKIDSEQELVVTGYYKNEKEGDGTIIRQETI